MKRIAPASVLGAPIQPSWRVLYAAHTLTMQILSTADLTEADLTDADSDTSIEAMTKEGP
jgi:hypothetical protein